MPDVGAIDKFKIQQIFATDFVFLPHLFRYKTNFKTGIVTQPNMIPQ